MLCYILTLIGKETGVMIDKDKVPRSSWRKSPGGDYMIATVRVIIIHTIIIYLLPGIGFFLFLLRFRFYSKTIT